MSSNIVKLMGVINVTPDSFSDGGQHNTVKAALKKAVELLSSGADFVDIGAESTRPGADPLTSKEEWLRLEPILTALVGSVDPAKISVDTRHPETMLKVLDLGIKTINDVSGAIDDEVLKKISELSANYIAMHIYKDPKTMQVSPLKGVEAVSSVEEFFKHTQAHCLKAGIAKERIYLDPGIGFGKDDEANAKLLAKTFQFSKSYQVVVGVSRKSFIGRSLDIPIASDRDHASKMLEFGLMMMGAAVIRTHDIAPLSKLRTYLGDGHV